MTDPYGEAIKAYFEGDMAAALTVESDLAETDEWPVSEFFHNWDTMGQLEKRAMSLASGRVLDVGAGSGSHSLWLQQHGMDVEAVEISPLAADHGCRTCMLFLFTVIQPQYRMDRDRHHGIRLQHGGNDAPRA